MAARRSLRLRPEIATRVPDTAMVMAAGLGKRMRPLTATRPKPLIDHVFDKLRAAGITRAVVNVHYLADVLEAHLAANAGGIAIKVSDERDLLLETGGGLVRAAPMIDCDPFFAINSDNFWVDGPSDT
ncbi:MAG TPA: sugar phosphate nucleotidyltransferase, partial [Sphingomicrobium sp.]|nr:sugar phosphate nucleotidyltransferase [Sphingomicrobium sp.]